ncbi:unnamed protein product, partial [Amoebophrya sp. A120]
PFVPFLYPDLNDKLEANREPEETELEILSTLCVPETAAGAVGSSSSGSRTTAVLQPPCYMDSLLMCCHLLIQKSDQTRDLCGKLCEADPDTHQIQMYHTRMSPGQIRAFCVGRYMKGRRMLLLKNVRFHNSTEENKIMDRVVQGLEMR